jgi:elongation factor G
MVVSITIPESYMGDVSSDLNTKRGRIQSIDSAGPGYQRIKANVPMSEMLHYATSLRSITQGRGTFEMDVSHYEEVPANIQQELVAAYKKSQATA